LAPTTTHRDFSTAYTALHNATVIQFTEKAALDNNTPLVRTFGITSKMGYEFNFTFVYNSDSVHAAGSLVLSAEIDSIKIFGDRRM
jgi:hypothetical protein